LQQTKQRLNIPDEDKTIDKKIGTQMSDADSYVNVQVGVHAVTPLTNPDDQIISLASGLAASLYNYWQTPAKDRTLEGVKEWKNEITNHIKAVYGQRSAGGTTGDTFTSTKGVTGTET
jgi:hypothetical protein